MKNFLNILLILSLSFFSLFNVKAAEDDNFVLDKIIPISFNEISLYFNSNLEEGDNIVREFRIFATGDSLDELNIISNTLNETDKSIINLTFDEDALPGVEYELVVIDLNDENGRNIESWIDWLGFFTMPEFFDDSLNNVEITTETGGIDIDTTDVNVEISTSDGIDVELNAPSEIVTWQNLDEDDIEKNTLSESNNVTVLPTTWTWHLFIFILSVILALLIFIFKVKKYN